jgi:hypothetical protein
MVDPIENCGCQFKSGASHLNRRPHFFHSLGFGTKIRLHGVAPTHSEGNPWTPNIWGKNNWQLRWSISVANFERWRSEGLGPKFLQLPGRVLYRQVDIEAFEESCLSISTKTFATSDRATAIT